mmetsp:Transcript_14820/g.34783  ORF Transcript_14820/g.34783 Transcript_14820/m.34783 type:complete len:203 (+) Transcript_14820:1373-1981(+)
MAASNVCGTPPDPNMNVSNAFGFVLSNGKYDSFTLTLPRGGFLILDPMKAPAAAPIGPPTTAPPTVPASVAQLRVSWGRHVSGTQPSHVRSSSPPSNWRNLVRLTVAAPRGSSAFRTSSSNTVIASCARFGSLTNSEKISSSPHTTLPDFWSFFSTSRLHMVEDLAVSTARLSAIAPSFAGSSSSFSAKMTYPSTSPPLTIV